MFNKKNIIIFVLIMFYIMGCGKKTIVNYPDKTDLGIKEAYELVINEVKKVHTPKDMKFLEMLVDGDGKSVVYVWKGNKKAYYIRHWLYDGSKLRVEISYDGSKYVVALKSNGGDTGDCYGYTNSMPVPRPMRFDIYWNESYKNGCYQYVRFYFDNKEEAIKFAQAMKLVFVDNNILDVVYKIEDEKLEETKDTLKEDSKYEVKKDKNQKTSPVQKEKCSVEKIIKMKEIGLSLEEIKKICE